MCLSFPESELASSFVCRIVSSYEVEATVASWRFKHGWMDMCGYRVSQGLGRASYEAIAFSFQMQPSALCSVKLELGLCKPHQLCQLALTTRGTRETLQAEVEISLLPLPSLPPNLIYNSLAATAAPSPQLLFCTPRQASLCPLGGTSTSQTAPALQTSVF